MATIKINPLAGQIKGRINDLVFRRHGNTTVVYEYVKPQPTEATIRQKGRREEFKKAIEYAKKAMRNPYLKIRYQLKAREDGRGNAYNAAIKDFLNKPIIRKTEIFDKCVIIDARDDFQVARVEVKLLNKTGEVVEEGFASLSGDRLWHYCIKKTVAGMKTIKAVAYDVPGNFTEMVITI